MGKPKARPLTKQAGTGTWAATRPGSNSTGRPSSVARMRQLALHPPRGLRGGKSKPPQRSGARPQGSARGVRHQPNQRQHLQHLHRRCHTLLLFLCQQYRRHLPRTYLPQLEKVQLVEDHCQQRQASPNVPNALRDADRQVEDETMVGLMEGATAYLEPPPPSHTPSPPTGLGCASCQETAAGISTVPATEQPMRRAEARETPRGEATAAAVEGGSIAAASASARAVEEATEAPAEAMMALRLAGGSAAAFWRRLNFTLCQPPGGTTADAGAGPGGGSGTDRGGGVVCVTGAGNGSATRRRAEVRPGRSATRRECDQAASGSATRRRAEDEVVGPAPLGASLAEEAGGSEPNQRQGGPEQG
ncbi:unnamed protein product [Closterium sp. NIES-64]|nr:unnamed protein product [Closterium sp. NIES-65]CAI5987029.1 unnamed protein product [Closterium sp. NIES-64]